MTDTFLDRGIELSALEDAWMAPGGKLALVWGRRRSGKTRLLGEFVNAKRAIFYGATQQSPAAELAAFSSIVREAIPATQGDLLAHGDFPTWTAAFEYVAARASGQRLAVVIDELPYLVAEDPSLPSILQRFWDHHGRKSELLLVLCGSSQSVMLELQAQSAPLFGRADVRLHVRPFSYANAALFVPKLPPAEQAVSYGVMGGMPGYLSRWDDDQGHVANLRRLFADPASPLLDEGEFVLTSELPAAAGYFRILNAIANGHRTFSTIQRFADIDIKRQLDRLLELELVEREVPITEDPRRSRRVIYRIGDNFLSFWFRFIYGRNADIARGLGRQVVDRTILPNVSDYMGEPWEVMCRDHVRSLAAQDLLPKTVSTIGRWWNRDNSVEIDIVGLDGKHVVLAGSVKWASRVHRAELNRLRRAVESLPNRAEDLQLILFAREEVVGVTENEALCRTAADLYAGIGSS